MLIRHSINALVFIDPHPLDGVATGETPDHHIAFPDAMLADLVSVGDVDGNSAPCGSKFAQLAGWTAKVIWFSSLLLLYTQRGERCQHKWTVCVLSQPWAGRALNSATWCDSMGELV